jgi:hypothetical protein
VWGLAFLLLACHLALSARLLNRDSLTSDEPLHMTAGFLAAKDRDLRINREHPPLAKALAGLGLITGDFSFPYHAESYRNPSQYRLTRRFFSEPGNDPVRMTRLARWPILLLCTAFGLFLFLFVRILSGNRAGLVTLLLYAFSPTVLGHNHLVTTDAAAMVFCFAGTALSWLALERRSYGLAVAGGMGLGLAMLSKFSGLITLPVTVLTGAVFVLRARGRRVRTLLVCACVVVMSASTVLWGCWVFGANTPGNGSPLRLYLDGLRMVREHVAMGHDHPQFLLGQYSYTGWWTYFPAAFVLKTSVFLQLLLLLGVLQAFRKTRPGDRFQNPSFVESSIATSAFLSSVRRTDEEDHNDADRRSATPEADSSSPGLAFFDRGGEKLTEKAEPLTVREPEAAGGKAHRDIGSEIASKAKQPAGTEALRGQGCAASPSSSRNVRLLGRIQQRIGLGCMTGRLRLNDSSFPGLGSLFLFPLCYTIYCLTSRLNIGFRHFMPVLPFVFVFVGVQTDRFLATKSRVGKALVAVLLAGYVLSTLASYPRYIGFFTEWARTHPERFLNDSNLDWGQDLGRLAEFMDAQGIPSIRLDYFGSDVTPDIYLRGRYEPWPVDRGLPESGWLAVSEFFIMTSRFHKQQGRARFDYDLLETREPEARIGSSIRVYRFP